MPAPRLRSPFRATLRVEALDSRDVPAFLTGAEVVVGADAGAPPLVRVIDANTQTVQSQLLVFGGNFYGGVRVAVADVNGDGTPDLIAAAGPSGTPAVQVFSGADGSVLASFLAFDAGFTGGVNIAAGDVDGDGKADIIAGAGAGGGPQVAVFDGGGNPIASFYAYAPNFLGGVRVAAADTTGDGTDEVVTVPGYGGGPDLRLFQASGGGAQQVGGFQAFADPGFTGGAYVAAGDVTGDGTDEVVVGAGPGGGPRVGVYTAGGGQLSSFFAYGADFLGGVRVGTADLTGDGVADVLTVAGPGGASQVNVYPGLTTTPAVGLYGFPTAQMAGAFVAGSGTSLTIPSTPADQVAASYAQLQTFDQNGQSIVPIPVYIPVYYGGYGYTGYYPYYPFGLGFGLYGGYYGASYYDAPGLYAPVSSSYQPSFFGGGNYSDPTYGTDPGYTPPEATPTPAGPETLPAPTPVLGATEAVASSGSIFGGRSASSLGGYSSASAATTYTSPSVYSSPASSYGSPNYGGSGYGGGFSDFGGGFEEGFA